VPQTTVSPSPTGYPFTMGRMAQLLAGIVALATAGGLLLHGGGGGRAGERTACVYSGNVSTLRAFGRLVHRDMSCSLVFNDAAPDWRAWENPWFLHHVDPNLNWARWLKGAGGRRLVVTQNLFPSSVNRSDWRDAGARGAYAGHARRLAQNLVRSGAGDAVIRLAHEGNGTWYPDNVGATPRDFARWRMFWRRTARAMAAVPGARFRFDWTVNAAYRRIPLQQIYPGDDVVDIVGVDAYDTNVQSANRWPTIYARPGGVRDVRAFARAHGKPLSVPEWGVGPRGGHALGAGDDPAYVDGLARVVSGPHVAYQSYFFAHEWGRQLANAPRSLAAYRRHFGG
jgi:hypothetical protein